MVQGDLSVEHDIVGRIGCVAVSDGGRLGLVASDKAEQKEEEHAEGYSRSRLNHSRQRIRRRFHSLHERVLAGYRSVGGDLDFRLDLLVCR